MVAFGTLLTGFATLLFWGVCWPLEDSKRVCTAIAKNPPWSLLTGLAAAPALILTWWWRTVHKDRDIEQKRIELKNTLLRDKAERQEKSAQEARLLREERSSRFIGAIQLLAADKIEARLGAIYALESLANDAAEQIVVVETLCAFVRMSTSRRFDEVAPTSVPTDIEAAFCVVERIEPTDSGHKEIRLSGTRLPGCDCSFWILRGADFSHADFTHAQFTGADLSSASFWWANLSEASLADTNLSSANLGKANLSDALFWHANLSGADLCKANLTRAQLTDANLSGTNLGEANLSDALFCDANLSGADLTGTIFTDACFERAKYTTATRFHPDFNPIAAGMVLVDDSGNPIPVTSPVAPPHSDAPPTT